MTNDPNKNIKSWTESRAAELVSAWDCMVNLADARLSQALLVAGARNPHEAVIRGPGPQTESLRPHHSGSFALIRGPEDENDDEP